MLIHARIQVADCVSLFSLNQPGSIPVDTHVWDIAVRDYDASLSEHKSLTPTVYDKVGNLFRSRFGGMHMYTCGLMHIYTNLCYTRMKYTFR